MEHPFAAAAATLALAPSGQRGERVLPTIARLKEAFSYDAHTGVLRWKIKSGKSGYGRVAGSVNQEGYRRVNLDGCNLMAHRVIWAMCTGSWPSEDIDHRNGFRDDNRFCNLRECSDLENMQNYPIPANNSSGYIGVSRHSQSGKWQVHIRCGGKGKRLSLGYFDDKEEAARAYAAKKAELHTFNPTTRSAAYAH